MNGMIGIGGSSGTIWEPKSNEFIVQMTVIGRHIPTECPSEATCTNFKSIGTLGFDRWVDAWLVAIVQFSKTGGFKTAAEVRKPLDVVLLLVHQTHAWVKLLVIAITGYESGRKLMDIAFSVYTLEPKGAS